MRPVRILFLTQVWPWPLDAGPKVRAHHVLRHLAGRGHRITLASFVRDGDADDGPVRALCEEVVRVRMPRSRLRDAWHLLASLAGGAPFLLRRDRVPAMAAALRRLPEFDAVHADQLWMAPYAREARAGRSVLDCHNAVFEVPQRLAQDEPGRLRRALLARESRKLAEAERRLCAAFDRVVWVSARDRALLRRPESDAVIPICVDPGAVPVVARDPAARRVTFVGGMHWPPNAAGIRWFARRVWPRVRAAAPDAGLTVVGRDPPAELRRDPAVETPGHVADLGPLLGETAVFVVPLRAASGMRVKILDAWCRGLPVVSTGIGAEGLDARDGENALLADDADAFAGAVLRLLADPSLGRRLGAGGRAAVEANHDWRSVYAAWDRVYA